MSPHALDGQLNEAGRRINRWRASVKLRAGASGLLAFVWIFSLLDLWVRYERGSRFGIWTAALCGAVGLSLWIQRTLARRHTVESVAAMIEGAFPQLDNHLINYIQFSTAKQDDEFKRAYVRQGVPGWEGIHLDGMRNRKAQRRAGIALATAFAMFVVPGLFVGKAWGIAVWRIVNPFVNATPASLTRIVSIEPGNATVLQGSPLVLSCKVQGWAGHRVTVDIAADDKKETTYVLGKLTGNGVEEFDYRMPKVNTRTRYRFHAGDAPFAEWFTIATRPPLALTDLRLNAKPPAYTRAAEANYQGLTNNISFPFGSEISLQLQANLPIQTFVALRGKEETALAQAGSPTDWRGALVVTSSVPLTLTATGRDGDRLEQALPYSVLPDRRPEIAILAPEGQTVLAPGAQPEISFSVQDDYGVAEVSIELVAANGPRDAQGITLATWTPGSRKEFLQTWKGQRTNTKESETLAYRIVARDNCPFGGEDHIARSATIVFNAVSADQAAQKRSALEKEAFEGLSRVIALQQQNIEKTKMYQKIIPSTTAEHWQDTADRQTEIRKLTKSLLANPVNPLGNLSATVSKLYMNEMSEVIPMLSGVPACDETQRTGRVDRAVALEAKILRQLTFADSAADKTMVQRRISAVTTLLSKIIKGQTDVRTQTQSYTSPALKVSKVLVDAEDQLAMDVTEFRDMCRTESDAVKGNDTGYSALLAEVAGLCDSLKINGDMLLASEQLEQNNAGAAVPHETSAIDKLKKIEARLSEVVAKEETEEKEAMMEALEEAKKRIEKVQDVQKKALENMLAVASQKDKASKDVDMMEEEYQELMKNTKEALLQVPTDLNIFMELNVANDIVEDVFQVFEEIEQAKGSEQAGAQGAIKENARAKEEGYLEGMEEAKDRIDKLEGWLADKPDVTKFTPEAFDREEMPKAGMALGALTTEAEDIIGDLLKQSQDEKKDADDAATNTGVPDMLANNEIKEGDVASFAAQGKSGNETPEHKEQDGRSNVGRQGMAVGETAAGSGTINEGDENIEKRRTSEPTQSGQIDVKGENVKTEATGGGKQGTGKADERGMEGGTKRMDSTEQGSRDGLDSLMAKRADALYAKASMQNIRADELKQAAHHLRQADDAIAKGYIGQMREQRKMAVVALKKAKAQMDATITGGFDIRENPSVLDNTVDGGPDMAPPKYRDQVAEYYKMLNDAL